MRTDQPTPDSDHGNDSQQDSGDNDQQDDTQDNNDDSIPYDPVTQDERPDLHNPFPGGGSGGGGGGGITLLNPFANNAKEQMKENEDRRQKSLAEWERLLKTRLD